MLTNIKKKENNRYIEKNIGENRQTLSDFFVHTLRVGRKRRRKKKEEKLQLKKER
jgi:hypothetical protein